MKAEKEVKDELLLYLVFKLTGQRYIVRKHWKYKLFIIWDPFKFEHINLKHQLLVNGHLLILNIGVARYIVVLLGLWC